MLTLALAGLRARDRAFWVILRRAWSGWRDALVLVRPRVARIVELRAFAGLTIAETAEALGVSDVTVGDDWALAKAWLARALATH